MNRLLQDLRVGIRSLRHTPRFAIAAVLTLGLGIGLATAVFTIANALLLRRLPVDNQTRLIVLWGTGDGTFNYPVGFSDSREFGLKARTVERTGLFLFNGAWPLPIREGDKVSRLRRALVSGDFFDALGVRAELGRALRPADDVQGAAPVVVLSHSAWRQRFNGDPQVVGHRVVLYGDGAACTIVGVMPRGLDYPTGTDFWQPVVPSMPPAGLAEMGFYIVGRLRPGATPSHAADELTAFFRRPEAPPWQRNLRGVASLWPRLVIGNVRPALIAFAAAAGLLLLITCINVANLLLVRGFARVREVAVRSALGANRAQIVWQLLTENALLAIAGGAVGIAVAAAAIRGFVAFAPAGIPRLDEIQLNATALIGALAITAIAMAFFGLAPAILTSRLQIQQSLRSDTRQTASRRARFSTEALVAGQMALAVLVLSSAGVIARSLIKLERAELRLEPTHLLIGDLALEYGRYADPQVQRAMLNRLVAELEAIPGVRAASPVVAVPFSGTGGWDGKPVAEGQSQEDAAANPMLNMEVVVPDYFATLGVSLLRGRGFTDRDREGVPLAVVVSQATAHHYWPGDDPIGKRLKLGPNLELTANVIGVVPDTRYRDLREARPSIYFPLAQSPFPFMPTTLAIRTTGRPDQLIPTIRRVISEKEPGIALASAAPFEAFLAGPLAQPRLNAFLLAVFAIAAVALAAVGLFGVTATMVRQRTPELGIRLALGAAPADLRRMVMRRGLGIAAVGSIVGLLCALVANRLLVAMLYEVSPTDALTLAGAVGSLLAVAVFATLIPARSSTRIDPVLALRAEG